VERMLSRLTPSLGLDALPERLRAWREVSLVRKVDCLQDTLVQLAGRKRLPGWFDERGLDDTGRRFLVERTHFLRHASSDSDPCRAADIEWCLALASAVSGVEIVVRPREIGCRGATLLEGSNLFLDSTAVTRCTFDRGASEIRIDGMRAKAHFSCGGVWIEHFESERACALPFDGDFVTFYVESGEEKGGRRMLATEPGALKDRLEILALAKGYLRDSWPHAWQCIAQIVRYVNWTERADPLGIDSREHLGSVRLNDRRDLPTLTERVAWLAATLYREAKHIQFHETFLPEIPPGLTHRARAFAVLGSDIPQIPCSWSGVPSGRSLPEHLMAMQGLVPGMAVYLDALRRVSYHSDQTRAHIAMDMRAINGAMGSLELGRRHLTELGGLLADVLRADYVTDLVPRYLITGEERSRGFSGDLP
jgi:hypothetical protein